MKLGLPSGARKIVTVSLLNGRATHPKNKTESFVRLGSGRRQES